MPEAIDPTTLLCLFPNDASAAAAVHNLLALGLSESEIAVIGDAHTELSGKVQSATLASIQIPDEDLPRMLKGIEDGGTVVAVQTTGTLAEQAEAIFSRCKTPFVAEKADPSLADHFRHVPERTFTEPDRLDMVEPEETV